MFSARIFMKRIVIIGSPGAGKTTLARGLHSILDVNVFHLDRLFWKSGWTRKTRDERIDILQNLIAEKQWIIEGTYLNSSEIRLTAADTIIFLNIPFYLCLWHLVKRHYAHQERRRDIPDGCVDRLTFLRLLIVLIFPLTGRKKIKQTLQNYQSKHIVPLCSTQAVEDFLTQLKQDVYAAKNPSSINAAREKSRLVHS